MVSNFFNVGKVPPNSVLLFWEIINFSSCVSSDMVLPFTFEQLKTFNFFMF